VAILRDDATHYRLFCIKGLIRVARSLENTHTHTNTHTQTNWKTSAVKGNCSDKIKIYLN